MTSIPSSQVPDAAGMKMAAANGWAWPTPWIQAPSVATSVDRGAHARVGSGPTLLFRDRTDRATPCDSAVRAARGPTALMRLYVEQGQSPWVDGLDRRHIQDGTLARMVKAGIRGVNVNATHLAVALESGPDYDEQLSWLISTGCSREEAYRELAATDVLAACAVLHQVYLTSQGGDGFVSLEVAPGLASRTRGAMAAARRLHQRIDRPNLLVAVPATVQGMPALRALVSVGRNINATSIFSLERYSAVIDAYLSGLEMFIAHGGDPATVHGAASFAVGPVDAEVDKRLAALHGHRGEALSGRVAVAQARLAYRLFEERFSTHRWARLASHGAHPPALVWTSADSPSGADLEHTYVERLVAPDTTTVMTHSAAATLDFGSLVDGTLLDIDEREAAGVLNELGRLGVDLDQVAVGLEIHRAQRSQRSVDHVLNRLHARREHP